AVERLAAWATRNLLALVVGAYLLAAIAPAAGLALKAAVVARPATGPVTLPMGLLAGLLFNARPGSAPRGRAGVVRRPRAVLAGLAANVLVPPAVLVLLGLALRQWHDPAEAACLLAGLAVVAAMPVAGSSAAYAQNTGGSGGVSLGLVVAS